MTDREKNKISSIEEYNSSEGDLISETSEIIGKNLTDRIVYDPEFDERGDVKKIYVIRGVCLYFVPIEGTDKYEFCSADKKLQERCESVKSKNVKGKNIRFIVDAAKKYMKGETELLAKNTSSVYANWRDNPVGTLQNILQRQGKMPEYSSPREGTFGGVTVKLSVDGYEPIIQWAQNQREARKACAIKFAEECLGIDVAAEQSLVIGEKPKPQQIGYQIEKMPDSFKVEVDDCGDWDEDAVSALQVFCQKNKLGMPRYIDGGTSQGYVTESTMRMELGGFSTVQSAPTKKEAKQKCARAFYEKLKSGSLGGESKSEDEDEVPNPALFKGWKVHPRYTLQDYCEYYGIELIIEDEIDRTIMKIGGEEFYTRDEDYDGNYKSPSEIKDELAKLYYDTKIRPILKNQEREKINNSSEDVLDNFPVIDMSSYEGKPNLARTGVLNQLCAKAHIPNPWYETYKLKDGVETKCRFPAKINMKSWREGESRVVYMKIAGLKQKVCGEGKTFKEAQHDAARRFLLMMWERKNN